MRICFLILVRWRELGAVFTYRQVYFIHIYDDNVI